MRQLLGPDGQPVKKQVLLEEEATPTMTGIRSYDRESMSGGLTPSRLASLLRDAEDGSPEDYLALAEEMEEKDLHYLSVMSTRKRAVSQRDIIVEPASDDKNDIVNAEIVESFLNREALQDEIFDIMDAVGKGFSVTEILWDTSEKQWMPKALNYVDPRWFEFDRTDKKTIYLKSDEDPKPLDPYKWITFFSKAKSGIPIRGGIARVAGWAYLFKNFTTKSWVTFAEVYGQPLRVGKYGSGATENDKRTLLRAVANIGQDAAAIIPENMLIEFVDSNSRASADLYKQLADYMDQQISKAVLGQTTTTDAISGGHAVSKEHNDVRGDIANADGKQLLAALKSQLIIPLVNLNRGVQERYPTLRFVDDDAEDTAKLADSLGKLVPLGLRVSQNQIRGKFGLDAPEKDEEILGINQPAEQKIKQDKSLASLAEKEESDADEIDLAVEEMLEGWEEVLTPVVNPLTQAVQSAGSYEEARENLTKAVLEMQPEELAEMLAERMFAARAGGKAGVKANQDEK